MLDKLYNPASVEQRIYEAWQDSGAFSPSPQQSEPYTIVIPPPNITGNLHIGHALNNVIQDILARYQRLCGKRVLWQPGTDHASIATQMVVEKRLAELGEPSRHVLGREAFIAKVWQWKAESGGNITNQLRRLGASCDWSRERFTLDEGLSRAVLKCFVDLHAQGLIYRDKRLVNWDPVMETAISDLEVVQKEVCGSLWYFRYSLLDSAGVAGGESIAIATTRPETMLGDTAIAVHPDDVRYRSLIGRYALQPLTGRHLLIVGDTYADPEQGTGAVKITPAHDFHDFEVAKRHGLPLLNVMTLKAAMNENVPPAYRGLDRFVAREAVIQAMQDLGFYDAVSEHEHVVPYGDRGGVPIEPLLTEQWFLDAKILAGPAIEAVRSGQIKFVPENWTHTYYDWMENIQPWCISRQLWWGHQIPAWYGEDGEVFVALDETEAYAAARQHYGREDIRLRRDEDVLDTWFSSALWAFSTLGWPEQNEVLQKHYPTDVLVTGFDIIFFWVARMIMFGLRFMGREPFHTVYVHALVRDAEGQKMSKSKGNVIDPLDLLSEYGCDALRFTLARLAAPGRDIKLSSDKVATSRNFITKLWNAARFCEMNACNLDDNFDIRDSRILANLWMLQKTRISQAAIEEALRCFRFHDAAAILYHFVWGNFCDSYLEMIKPILYAEDSLLKDEVRSAAAWFLQQILLYLHPFVPFVTEELWQKFYPNKGLLITATWPHIDIGDVCEAAYPQVEWALQAVVEIRSARARLNIAPAKMLDVKITDLACDKQAWLEGVGNIIEKLGRVQNIAWVASDSPAVQQPAIRIVIQEATFVIAVAGVLDIDAEKARLKTAAAKQGGEITKLQAKLNNENFTAKAPPHIIAANCEKLQDAENIFASLKKAINMLD